MIESATNRKYPVDETNIEVNVNKKKKFCRLNDGPFRLELGDDGDGE